MSRLKKAAGARAGGTPSYWTATPEWRGETVFVIAGGPSVADQDLERLRRRAKVVVINSSLYRVPWADLLFFADHRWWKEHEAAVAAFAGRVVHCTTTPDLCGERVLYLGKRLPPGLSLNRHEVTCRRTAVTAVLNLLVHLGAVRAVLLGVDGGPAADGRTHHHEPYPWDPVTGIFDAQRAELATIVDGLADLGIEVLNASPVSTLPFWPRVSFEEISSCP